MYGVDGNPSPIEGSVLQLALYFEIFTLEVLHKLRPIPVEVEGRWTFSPFVSATAVALPAGRIDTTEETVASSVLRVQRTLGTSVIPRR